MRVLPLSLSQDVSDGMLELSKTCTSSMKSSFSTFKEHALDLAMEALAAEAAGLAFDEDEALGADDTVLCPVCSRGYLLQGRALEITCASCDLCLPDQLDGLGLGHLRDLLARTFEAHADRGCDKRPAFVVDRELGVALLRCDCAACGFRHVVI